MDWKGVGLGELPAVMKIAHHHGNVLELICFLILFISSCLSLFSFWVKLRIIFLLLEYLKALNKKRILNSMFLCKYIRSRLACIFLMVFDVYRHNVFYFLFFAFHFVCAFH